MWKEISLFEVRYQVRQPLFVILTFGFFVLAIAVASSDIGTAVGDAPGTTLRNAPINVAHQTLILSLLGLFAITAFVASAGLRDFERGTAVFFFTKPLGKVDFLAGRFIGSMVVSLLVLLAAVAGLMVANFLPWQPAERLGPFRIGSYLFGLSVIVVPNLLMMGSLFFALAIWSKRLTLTYLCVVFFIGMQDVIEVLVKSLDSRVLGSLLEPSGIVALETVARYWTIAEQNTLLPEFGGVLLANRLVWLGLGLTVLAASFARFDFTTRERRPRRATKFLLGRARAAASDRLVDDAFPQSPQAITMPQANRKFTAWSHWRQLLRQTRLEVSEVIPRTPFLMLLAIGLVFVIAYSLVAGMNHGTPSYPLTHLMLESIQLGVRMTLVMIIVFYGGELVFSQRSLKLSEVYDALPVPNWVFLVSKVAALVCVAGVFLLAATFSTVAIQTGKGFVRLEPALYAQGLIIIFLPLLLLIALAVFLQVLSNHKITGVLLMMLVLLLRYSLNRLGIEDNLYLYGSFPPITYSGINAYGHHVEPFLWFMAYWGFAALVLLAGALLLWPRGTESSMRNRLAIARLRLSKPILGAICSGVLGMLVVGSWIFYNTHLRNSYLDHDRIVQRLAEYEEKYQQYRDVALPRVTSVFAEVDIFPRDRRVEIRGRYRLENQGAEPVRILPITISPRWVEGVLRVYGGVSLETFDLPPHQVLVEDEALGFYVVELTEPLLEGDAIDLSFTVQVDHGAFANRRHNNLVVENGTFFSNRNFLPVIGYARSNQLLNPTEREKRGMPLLERVPELGDGAPRDLNYLGADWVRFEAIISTRADQIAIAPGDLEREWTEGDRRYFHYKTSAPIINLIPFMSGDYEVVRDRWEQVDIELYFHPGHTFNVERFMETTKRSLAYMTANFGPYTHDQLRIVEVPSYHDKTAFAFAQTIAVSESWLFAEDLGADDLDWLTIILAHEISHQWWNYQVVPGDVQGATLIAESLAQYSAMMILEEMYGPEKVRRFLKYSLDQYLKGRGTERVQEMPLALVENQAYVHYSKGSLALYALRDWIGEASLNRGLREFLEANAFGGPPYPTSRDLLSFLGEATPPEKKYLIEDLFETITLFDNRVVGATFTEQRDGTFLVELETSSLKLRGDGLGASTEIAIDDWVDIGIFGEQQIDGRTEETVLVLEKHHLKASDGRFEFVVDQRPVRAGIDPYNKLIDRDSGDNVRALRELPSS